MDGDIELGGYLVRVAVIHTFGQSVFGRVDKQYRGLVSASLFEFAAAAAVAGVVAVLPVDEFVDEGAAFARVGDAPVDEHGVGGEAVYAVEFAGKLRAGHMQVWCNVVQCHAHLPVAHARRQRERIRHAGSSPSPSNLCSSS